MKWDWDEGDLLELILLPLLFYIEVTIILYIFFKIKNMK